MPVSLVATRFHLVEEVQVENLHPHGKTCTHLSLWRQDFILSGKCKLENLHPHGKMCTHVSCGDEISSCRGSASWKTRTHKRKLAPTWENLQPRVENYPRKRAPTKGLERISFRTDPSSTCSSHCGRPVYGSTFWRWHQIGHGFRKLIRLLEKRCRNGCVNCKS